MATNRGTGETKYGRGGTLRRGIVYEGNVIIKEKVEDPNHTTKSYLDFLDVTSHTTLFLVITK